MQLHSRMLVPLPMLLLRLATLAVADTGPESAAEAYSPDSPDLAPLSVDTAQQIWQVELLRLPPDALSTWVTDPSTQVRARAAEALGRLRSTAAVPHLAALAADPNATVREVAAFALGQTPESEAAIVKRWNLEGEPTIRRALAVALGKQGGVPAVDLLLSALDEPEVGPGAAEGLGRLAARKVDGAAHERVLRSLTLHIGPVPVGETRALAAWAISRIPWTTGDTATLARMAQIIRTDPDPHVRAWVLRAWAGLSTPETRSPVLNAAATDSAAGVRIAAARGIGKQGMAGADLVLARLLLDPDPDVRLEAIAAAGICPGVSASGLLTPLLGSTSANEAAATLKALAAKKALPKPAEQYLDPALFLAVRIAAAESINDPAVLVDLALNATEAPLRSAAAGHLLERPNTVAADVIRVLAGADGLISQAAADWLKDHPDSTMERPLLDRLKVGDLDRNEVRSFVSALARLYEAGRIARPAADARTILAPWLGIDGLGEDGTKVSAMLRLPAPLPDHPDRRIPNLTDVERIVSARIYTEQGEIRIALRPDEAPYAVWNFARLAEQGYYDGVVFHRVVPDFVIQAGDPRGDGWGGPGWEIPDEINTLRYDAGAVGMALSGPDTGGGQWFITLSPQPHLEGTYTVFGHVIYGQRAANAINQGARIEHIAIERLEPASPSASAP